MLNMDVLRTVHRLPTQTPPSRFPAHSPRLLPQVACLVLATHKALLPWLRDEREVLKVCSAAGQRWGGKQ